MTPFHWIPLLLGNRTLLKAELELSMGMGHPEGKKLSLTSAIAIKSLESITS